MHLETCLKYGQSIKTVHGLSVDSCQGVCVCACVASLPASNLSRRSLTTLPIFIMGDKKDLTKEQIKVIVSLHKAERPVREIARIVGVMRRCVQKWRRKFRMGGEVVTPQQKKRPGRVRKTSSRTLNVVKRQVDACPQITARELREQNPQLLGQVSVRTVQRRLHNDLEFRRRRALKKPLTTPRQQELRVAFATKYLQWDMAKWQQVLWSDEAVFTVSCNQGKDAYQ